MIEKDLDIEDDYPFNFDLERMKEALASPRTKYLISEPGEFDRMIKDLGLDDIEKCETCFTFDLERMKNAVESPVIYLPKNLNREEMRLFILNAKFEE